MTTARHLTRRGLAGTAATALTLALLPGVAAAEHLEQPCSFADPVAFSDVADDAVFGEAISCIAGFGIVQGVTDDRYAPTMGVTRGQAAIFVANYLETATGETLPQAQDNPFEDVTGGVASDAILKLLEAGIVRGTTSTTYEPQAVLTRGQMAAILFGALDRLGVPLDTTDNDSFKDVDGIFADQINALNNFTIPVALGFPDGTFRSSIAVTRGQNAGFTVEAVYQADQRRLFEPSKVGLDTVVFDTGDGNASGALDLRDEDGNELLDVTYGEEADEFTIDGVFATQAEFQAALDTGDALIVTDDDGDGDFDFFDLAG